MVQTNFTKTFQLKSVSKMADFDTDPLYLPKFKSNLYLILQAPSYRVMSVPGKKFDSQPSFVFKLILLHTPCCYGLEIT